MCNHCPFVRHIEQGLAALEGDYQDSDIGIVGINANNVLDYPEDAPEKMAQKNYSFPYLFDETQAIAKAYEAACTPDFFLFDHELKLVYRGQFDDSRPDSNTPVTGDDLLDSSPPHGGRRKSPNQINSISPKRLLKTTKGFGLRALIGRPSNPNGGN